MRVYSICHILVLFLCFLYTWAASFLLLPTCHAVSTFMDTSPLEYNSKWRPFSCTFVWLWYFCPSNRANTHCCKRSIDRDTDTQRLTHLPLPIGLRPQDICRITLLLLRAAGCVSWWWTWPRKDWWCSTPEALFQYVNLFPEEIMPPVTRT